MKDIYQEVHDSRTQARADIATATTLLDAGIYYASVFFSQQAAEKALKASLLERLGKSHKGHNLIAMADELQAPVEIMNAAAELNAEFLATRHPEIARGVPAQMYDMESAKLHLECAVRILRWTGDTGGYGE